MGHCTRTVLRHSGIPDRHTLAVRTRGNVREAEEAWATSPALAELSVVMFRVQSVNSTSTSRSM